MNSQNLVVTGRASGGLLTKNFCESTGVHGRGEPVQNILAKDDGARDAHEAEEGRARLAGGQEGRSGEQHQQRGALEQLRGAPHECKMYFNGQQRNLKNNVATKFEYS